MGDGSGVGDALHGFHGLSVCRAGGNGVEKRRSSAEDVEEPAGSTRPHRGTYPAARILAGANVTPAGARQATARARRVNRPVFGPDGAEM